MLDEKAASLDKDGNSDAAEVYRKNRLPVDGVLGDYQAFVRKQQKDINKTKIVEAYDDFLFKQQAALEEEFHAKNNFRTSIRGFKVRYVARDEKDAEMKAKKLQAKDKFHNIYCSEIGKWTPWDPKPHMVENQEYAQDELNSLMKKYKEIEDSREKFFEERTKDSKKVFGAPTSGTDSSGQFNSMFGGQGDLALQRKMEKPSITIEKVEVDEVKNEVVSEETQK
jgi:hypothetical protein